MATNASNPTAPYRLRAAERRIRALELRKAGATFRQIGQELQITEEGARRSVLRALELLQAQSIADADLLRTLELERLDLAALPVAVQVKAGHLGAVDRWVRLSERRARLLGLDAPERHAVDVQGTDQLRALLRLATPTELDVLDGLLARVQAAHGGVLAASSAVEDVVAPWALDANGHSGAPAA